MAGDDDEVESRAASVFEAMETPEVKEARLLERYRDAVKAVMAEKVSICLRPYPATSYPYASREGKDHQFVVRQKSPSPVGGSTHTTLADAEDAAFKIAARELGEWDITSK